MSEAGAPANTAVSGSGIGRRRIIRMGIAGALAAGFGYAGFAFNRDLSKARYRLAGESQLIRSRFGNLEYAEAGSGPALLMIHGTGGGFDQGLLFAEAVVRRGHRVIAPSRFGYLRSDYPAQPSSENQADAFVDLLDHLRIDSIVVGGGSAGALSAAQFALRHPDRCKGLVLLVPAANLRDRDPVEMTGFQKFFVEQMVTSDLLYWTMLSSAPDELIGTLLATDPALVKRASPHEQDRVRRILESMLPISSRTRGMLNDARLAGHPARMSFEMLSVPTLIISAADDRFGTAETARDLAAVIPRSRLLILPDGGHVWVGHDEEVAGNVSDFVNGLASARSRRTRG